MQSIPIVLLFFLAISLSNATRKNSQFFGVIKDVKDCERFNLDPVKNIARASVFMEGSRSRGSWIIKTNQTNFAVEECFKRISNPSKIILISVAKHFDKLRTFPRGPAWLHVNVAQGPNGATATEQLPIVLGDSSFKAVVFGMNESEVGPDATYTKEQIVQLMKLMSTTDVQGEKYILLNSVLLMRSAPEVFHPIAEEGPVGVLVYQEGETAAKSTDIVNRLATNDVQFLMDVSDQSYFWFQDADAQTTEDTTDENAGGSGVTGGGGGNSRPPQKPTNGAKDLCGSIITFVSVGLLMSFM